MDATRRARAGTLGCRFSVVLPKNPSVAALPINFPDKLRLLRTMHIPAALNGVEASAVSQDGLGLHLADPGAALSLLDGPADCDLGYHEVWCRFRMLKRHMAKNAGVHDLGRICGSLRVVAADAPAMALCIFWSPVLLLLDLFGFPSYVFGRGLVCLLFVSFLVPFSTLQRQSGKLGRLRFPVILRLRLVFRGSRQLGFRGSMKLLTSSHLRGGDKGLLQGILAGGVWNGFPLWHARGESFLVDFVVVLMGMGIFF